MFKTGSVQMCKDIVLLGNLYIKYKMLRSTDKWSWTYVTYKRCSIEMCEAVVLFSNMYTKYKILISNCRSNWINL